MNKNFKEPGIYDLDNHFLFSCFDKGYKIKFKNLKNNVRVILPPNKEIGNKAMPWDFFEYKPIIDEIVITGDFAPFCTGCQLKKIILDDNAWLLSSVSRTVLYTNPYAEIISTSEKTYIENGCLINIGEEGDKTLIRATKDAPENLVLPDDISAIDSSAFMRTKVKSVSGNGILCLWQDALSYSSIESFDFPNLQAIHADVFVKTLLKDNSITLKSKELELSSSAFRNSGIKEVYISSENIEIFSSGFIANDEVKFYVKNYNLKELLEKNFNCKVKELTLDNLIASNKSITEINDIMKTDQDYFKEK